jgi:hypothetical protein
MLQQDLSNTTVPTSPFQTLCSQNLLSIDSSKPDAPQNYISAPIPLSIHLPPISPTSPSYKSTLSSKSSLSSAPHSPNHHLPRRHPSSSGAPYPMNPHTDHSQPYRISPHCGASCHLSTPSDLAYVRHCVARIGSHLASHTISARKGYSEDVQRARRARRITWSHMVVCREGIGRKWRIRI